MVTRKALTYGQGAATFVYLLLRLNGPVFFVFNFIIILLLLLYSYFVRAHLAHMFDVASSGHRPISAALSVSRRDSSILNPSARRHDPERVRERDNPLTGAPDHRILCRVYYNIYQGTTR